MAGKFSDVLYPNVIVENAITSNIGLPGGGFTAIDTFNIAVRSEVSPGRYHVLLRMYYNPHRSNVAETHIVLAVH